MRSALWRDRAFVRLFAANTISQLGTQFSVLALPLAALYWGTIPVGSLLAGGLAGPLGLRATLVAAGVGATASCLPIMVSPIRSATVPADAGATGDGGVAAPAR
jgi:hypothetical protein